MTITVPDITTELLNPELTDGTGWNEWPSIPVLNVDEVDPFNPHAAYAFGKLIGSAVGFRQVRTRNIPTEVPVRSAHGSRLAIPRHELPSHSLTNVSFTWAGPKGQEDSITGRNILALIDFPARWESGKGEPRGGYRLVHPAVIVRLGCAHDYEVLTQRNCYTRQRCRLCSHTFAVDSGD